ncbi:MAG TPA: YoaK family protein [Acidimicrobiia bacterium]|nr:YoaK family protein [Acidimicrobiia bacterium]
MVWPAMFVAVLLAAVTGFVDAVAFGRFLGVFPANQSGNAVFLGMAIGGSPVSTVWRPASAMVGFALGIVVGQLVRRRVHRSRLSPWLLGCEFVLFVVAIAITGPIERVHLIGGGKGFVLIVLTSMAMGVQTEVIRHVAGTAVATTYQTGAIARLGEAISRLVSRAARLREEREVVVLLVVLVAYVGGAAVGAAAPGVWRWSMILAATVVAALAVLWFVAPSRFVTSREDN